jgi:L-alanine-DL-glutamate epimerase-like enolase superfamily enzyme
MEMEQEEESAEGEADMDSNPEMMEMLRELYQDMHIGIAVEVDGRITETNASYVDGSTVTLMDIDFAKILEDEEKFRELLNANPETVEEMKELVKDNPGIKVEIEESIRISFR